jgi:glycerol uptake facilitator-like aquaporin
VTAFRRAAAEFLGSGGLALVVVGSGIAAQRLSSDLGLQLFENAVATGLGLAVLIIVFQSISGAHFNPVVTLIDIVLHRRPARLAALYLPAQVAGAIAGAMLANVLFALPAVAWSTTERVTWPHLLSETVATAGLIVVIFVLARTDRSHLAGPVVGAYIAAAYFFTSSTSFANPAITIGRTFTDTFAGIAPSSVLPFIAAQLVGAAVGWIVVVLLLPAQGATAPRDV